MKTTIIKCHSEEVKNNETLNHDKFQQDQGHFHQ
jgi:hypothetical protein